MKIQHNHIIKDPQKVANHFSEKDGVEVKYVCTTELKQPNVPMDIFYRETPHPEFGNRYLGIYFDPDKPETYICNADLIEDLEFGMIEKKGVYYYSRSRHDYIHLENGKMIDGGRNYIRSSGLDKVLKVKDGEFVPLDLKERDEKSP